MYVAAGLINIEKKKFMTHIATWEEIYIGLHNDIENVTKEIRLDPNQNVGWFLHVMLWITDCVSIKNKKNTWWWE